MTTFADVAEVLRSARKVAELSEDKLARRAGVSRTTVVWMETVAKGDMSVSALLCLLDVAVYDLKLVRPGHVRTLEDIVA